LSAAAKRDFEAGSNGLRIREAAVSASASSRWRVWVEKEPSKEWNWGREVLRMGKGREGEGRQAGRASRASRQGEARPGQARMLVPRVAVGQSAARRGGRAEPAGAGAPMVVNGRVSVRYGTVWCLVFGAQRRQKTGLYNGCWAARAARAARDAGRVRGAAMQRSVRGRGRRAGCGRGR
jgi:hypothetical protein